MSEIESTNSDKYGDLAAHTSLNEAYIMCAGQVTWLVIYPV